MVIGQIGCHNKEYSEFREKYPRDICWMDYADKLEFYGFKTGKDF